MSLSVLHPGDMGRVKATGQMVRILAHADTWEPPVYIVDGAANADGEPTFEAHELEPVPVSQRAGLARRVSGGVTRG